MKNPLVSIIIRTKNEEKWIVSCLKAVFNQSYKNFEVILVDNNSTDKTVLKAKKFPITLVNIEKFLPGRAINDGIRASSGDYIVCLSGHCIPTNNSWLANLVKDLDMPNIAGIYGRQEPLSFTSDLDKRDLLTVFGRDKKLQIKDSFFHNANSSFTRKIWEKFPFDENVTNIEDRVWGEKVIASRFNIIYEPTASVYHWHGINQDLDVDRAKKIVRILESLESFSTNNFKQDLSNLKILAIIPVKGKTLKLKNKTLVERTINLAHESDLITDVVVATDNQHTADIAIEHGAEVPFIRPNELSEDYVSIFKVLQFTLEKLEDNNKYYDLVILLEEIYPFRSKNLIDDMIHKFVNGGFDTVFAGQQENRSIWKEVNGEAKPINNSYDLSMPSSLKENKNIIGMHGLCCVMQPSALRVNQVFSGKVGLFEINNSLSAFSIRCQKDLEIAESLDSYVN